MGGRGILTKDDGDEEEENEVREAGGWGAEGWLNPDELLRRS